MKITTSPGCALEREETMEQLICGKSLRQWEEEFPVVGDLVKLKETFWVNPKKVGTEEALKQ